jgi:hypothetical protein
MNFDILFNLHLGNEKYWQPYQRYITSFGKRNPQTATPSIYPGRCFLDFWQKGKFSNKDGCWKAKGLIIKGNYSLIYSANGPAKTKIVRDIKKKRE